MLQAILVLASKGFGLAKKCWQVTAGAVAVIAAFIFKRNYDNKLKKETIKEIENVARETTAREQAALDDATQSFLIKNNPNYFPDPVELERLRKTTSPSASQKAAAKRVLKKLRPKG